MPSIKKTRSGTFQLCVKNKLLPKTFWATFDTFEQAEQYGHQLERLLAQGIVPAALLEQAPSRPASWAIGRCISEYIRNNPVPVSDVKLLDTPDHTPPPWRARAPLRLDAAQASRALGAESIATVEAWLLDVHG